MSDDLYPNQQRGRTAEKWVAEKFSLEFETDRDWVDLLNPRTEARHGVKSARPDRRFRFWEDNHHSLSISGGQKTAWVDLVVLSSGSNPSVLGHRRVKPSTVTDVVNDRGGWNKSGHRRGSRQKKIPVGVFLSL